MIRVGRKFLRPHFCPVCHRLVLLTRHLDSRRCPTCHKRVRRHAKRENSVKRSRRKYNTDSYRKKANQALTTRGYCALCGSTKNLTCHHAVDVKTGEWVGKHLTVLCERCHEAWEQKVNIIRSRR